ncbi:MAG: 50S ribosomal protein L17 [Candidatus Levybacteria bacterium]|nr:50S ribosomal protein L17 [Candidatus Levybacteria bacterium]
MFGRRLKRDRNQRKALFRSLMGSLVLYGKIKTTEAKAKSIKGELEKMVTLAKSKGEDARNLLVSRLSNERVVERIILEIAPKFATRPGGYIRIVKMGPRLKDGARMVLMSWVEEVLPVSFREPKRKVAKPATTEATEKTSAKTARKQSKTVVARKRNK